MGRKDRGRDGRVVKTGAYGFEKVENFKYLGTLVNNWSVKILETAQSIQAGILKQVTGVSRFAEIWLYKTVIRSAVMYAAVTMRRWRRVANFRQTIIRRISGPKKINKQDEKPREQWGPKVEMRVIKEQRIRWLRNVNREYENSILKGYGTWKRLWGKA